MEELIVRYIHFVGIMLLTATLVAEHLLITSEMSIQQLKRVAIIDTIYGISAMVVLAAGLLLWFSVGKPAEFYTKNGLFHAKITLFIVIALLSIYPTVFFLKQKKSAQSTITIPKSILMVIRTELLLLLMMPLLAVFMARGYGLAQ